MEDSDDDYFRMEHEDSFYQEKELSTCDKIQNILYLVLSAMLCIFVQQTNEIVNIAFIGHSHHIKEETLLDMIAAIGLGNMTFSLLLFPMLFGIN